MVGQHPGGGGVDRAHRVERDVDHLAQRRRVPIGAQVLEVEGLVQLVGANVVGGALDGRGPGLGDADPLARVLVEDLAPAAVDLVHAVLVEEGHDVVAEQLELVGAAEVGQAGGLDQAVGDVDAEAVHAHVEPEAQDRAELVGDGRVVPVEVGLLGGEQVQVPVAGGAVRVLGAGPGRAAEDGLPVVGRQFALLALAGAEVVAVAQRGAGAVAQGALEPLVLVRGVVGNEVDDDPQPQLVRVPDEGVGVQQGAEHRVHGTVVGDVVAGVRLRRGVERREPDGVHAEIAQVGQAAADAGQVAHAVAVGVGETARIHLVDDRVPPPASGRADVRLVSGVGDRPGGVGQVLGHGRYPSGIGVAGSLAREVFRVGRHDLEAPAVRPVTRWRCTR